MGRSITVHCIGYGPEKNGTSPLYSAMNRLEIWQEVHKAKKRGKEIVGWYAQTGTGKRILAQKDAHLFCVLTKDVPVVKTVTCPICEGEGHNGRYFCPVCNGSGITKPGNEKHWQDWQLEDMRARHQQDKAEV